MVTKILKSLVQAINNGTASKAKKKKDEENLIPNIIEKLKKEIGEDLVVPPSLRSATGKKGGRVKYNKGGSVDARKIAKKYFKGVF